MKYEYCKECCFLKNGKCIRSGPTTDLIFLARKKKINSKKKCKNFKYKIRR